MTLPIKLYIRNLDRLRATPFSAEYKDSGQEPEVVIT